jgi:hypothetical protein
MLGQQPGGTWAGRLRGRPAGFGSGLPGQGSGGGNGQAFYGQLLALSGPVTIPAGGGPVLSQMDTIVDQVGFGKVTTAGNDVVLPYTATYMVAVDIEYTDGYWGGGTVEGTLDEVTTAGMSWTRNLGVQFDDVGGFAHNAGAIFDLQISPSDGAEHTADVSVTVLLVEPVGPLQRWSKVFTGDVWGLTFDGTYWWGSEGNSGLTVTRYDTDWAVVSTFEAPLVGFDRVRGITWDGTHLWITGDDDSGGSFTDQVKKVDTAGTEVSAFTASGGNAVGLAWDGTDLWFIEGDATGSPELRRYSTAGTLLQTVALAASRSDVAYHDGSLYLVDSAGSAIEVRDPSDGSVVDTIDVSDGVTNPTGVWISDDGILYVAKDGDGVYSRSGAL